MEGKCSVQNLSTITPPNDRPFLFACCLFAHTFILPTNSYGELAMCQASGGAQNWDKVPGVTAIQAEETGSAKVLGKNRLSSFEDKTGGQYGWSRSPGRRK